jgi:hypothetical protein
MYKVASRLAQDSARRLKIADLCERDFEPSDAERRDNLKAKVHAIEAQIVALPPKDPHRRVLGLEKFELCKQMSAIRPKWKGPDMGSCLIKVIKGQVTRHQWAMWVKMAEEFKAEADAIAAETNNESC